MIGEGSVGWGGGLAEGGSVMGRAVMMTMLMMVVTWNLQRVSLREQNREGGWLNGWSREDGR